MAQIWKTSNITEDDVEHWLKEAKIGRGGGRMERVSLIEGK